MTRDTPNRTPTYNGICKPPIPETNVAAGQHRRVVAPIQTGERLLRLPELLSIVGISRATAYRYLANGRLPAPVKLSTRCIVWKASTINEWMASLRAA